MSMEKIHITKSKLFAIKRRQHIFLDYLERIFSWIGSTMTNTDKSNHPEAYIGHCRILW